MLIEKDNLLITFEKLPEVIENYIKDIPEEYWDRKRSEDTWTIRQHFYHIVNVQEMLYQRFLTIKNEESPVIKPYFPENESLDVINYNSIQTAIHQYKELRKKQIALINGLTEFESGKEAKHDEYIRYNIPLLINHMTFHDYWHMYRIEELWLTRDEYFN